MYCKRVIIAWHKRWVTINSASCKRLCFQQCCRSYKEHFNRFWTHFQESPMVPEQMCGTKHFISHLWNIRSFVSTRVVKTLVKLCVVNFGSSTYTSVIYNFFKEILSQVKWQKKKKSPHLQYPEDHRKRRRKCPSAFHLKVQICFWIICNSSIFTKNINNTH